ncbi:MAG: hypothetical protein Q9182_004484 [Xanthomendoza sp. 2 TL-2023]
MDLTEEKEWQLPKASSSKITATVVPSAGDDYISIKALNDKDPAFVSKNTGSEEAEKYVAEKGYNGFDIRTKHTWEEVLEVAHNAEAKSIADASKNVFRRSGRRTQNYALAMSRIVNLIPGGDYTSILCGGLKIAFSMAHQMKEKREAIIEVFHEIPKTIKKAAERLEEYPDDEELFDAVTKLYLVVLEVIESMLQWLVDKSTWRKIGNLLKEPWCDKSVDVGLDDVEKQMQAVMERTHTLQNQRVGNIEIGVRKVELDVARIQTSTRNTERSLDQLVGIDSERQEALIGLLGFLQDKLIKSEWQNKRLARVTARVLRENKESQELINFGAQARLQGFGHESSQRRLLEQDQVKILIDVDPEVSSQDKQIVIVEGGKSTPSFQALGRWLMRDPRFQHCLTAYEAKGLLVDGRGQGSDKISSMSYVCALLIMSLQHTQPVIALTFFCGLHVAQSDPLHGPLGLLRSLIGQLLHVQQFDLSLAGFDHAELPHQDNVTYFLDLFHLLIEQLPEDKVLFCVIDGISYFEMSDQTSEMESIIKSLQELTQDRGTGPIFKLLMTSPRYDHCAVRFFSPDDHIILRDNAEAGGFLTAAQAMSYTDKLGNPRENLRPIKWTQMKARKKAIMTKGTSALRKMRYSQSLKLLYG